MRSHERALSSDYWDPHSLDDGCPWKRLEHKVDKEISKIRKELDAANKFATLTITEFRHSYTKTVAKRFVWGEQFNGFNYPVGTVVRFEEERLAKEKLYGRWSQPEYFSIRYLAVLYHTDLPGDEARALMFTSESFVREQRRLFFYTHPAVLTIGTVNHNRTLRSYWNDYDREGLERVKWLEVLQLGKGVPEEEMQATFVNLPTPSLSQA